MSQAQLLQRLIAEGEVLIGSDHFAEGEACAREVLGRQPRNAGGHYLMGFSALKQERHADALAYFDSALRTERVNPQVHFMAALCLAALGRMDEAIAGYRRALQYQPRFVEARANLALLLERTGRLEEAAEAYRRGLAIDAKDWMALNRLGYCERLLGHAEQSIEALRRALALQPAYAPAHNELALALLHLDRRDEAIASLRMAVAADPDFVEGWTNLAKLLYVEHLEELQVKEAGSDAPDPTPVVECFDRVLALDSANAELRYLRDSVAGVPAVRAPDNYIQSFFDRFASRFEARLLGELRYTGPQALARALAPLLAGRSGLRTVDLGCGTGLSGRPARPHSAVLVGVDLSAAMLERALARDLYDSLFRAEIGDWLEGREAGSIDLAIALDVFVHVGDLHRVMRSVARALAPAGFFAFSIEDLGTPADDYRLRPSGRFAHSLDYAAREAATAGLEPLVSDPFEIRQEAGRAIAARIVVLRKPHGGDGGTAPEATPP